MIIQRRILAIGNAPNQFRVEIRWDSPMPEEQPDGSLVYTDPSATWRVHDIIWTNLLSPQMAFVITLVMKNGQVRARTAYTGEVAEAWNLGVGQQPDLRETERLTISQMSPYSSSLKKGQRDDDTPLLPIEIPMDLFILPL